MMVCDDYQMYWAFVGGAAAAVAVLWPILILSVFAFGRHRPFASERELIIHKMRQSLKEQQRANRNIHRSSQWVEVRVPKSNSGKPKEQSPRVVD